MIHPESARLKLRGVSFSYGPATPVIRELALDVEPGEMVALLGDSGCGKTTVLKLVAGLLRPLDGSVLIDGAAVDHVPAERRRAALVFQKPLLFPHLTVGENVGFALKMRNAGASTTRERVSEALSMVRLDGYQTRRPDQLSGGQEQRVSLARALVSDPRILLLDEPFAALDESLRAEMRSLVRGIQRRLQLTAVFVTHDQQEAAAMAHRVAFMRDGQVSQIGSPREFYERPSSLETARFFGWQILRGQIQAGRLTTALGTMPCQQPPGPAAAAVRAEAIAFTSEGGVQATVKSSVDLGTRVSTVLELTSGESLELPHDPPELVAGQTVRITVDEREVRVFPAAKS